MCVCVRGMVSVLQALVLYTSVVENDADLGIMGIALVCASYPHAEKLISRRRPYETS